MNSLDRYISYYYLVMKIANKKPFWAVLKIQYMSSRKLSFYTRNMQKFSTTRKQKNTMLKILEVKMEHLLMELE